MLDALGSFVLLRPLAELRGGHARHLARQIFVDDMSGVVEITSAAAGPLTDRTRALWQEDAERRFRVADPAIVATLTFGEDRGTLFEVTERAGATRLTDLAARTSTGDVAGLELALSLAHALVTSLEGLHASGRALGSLALDDVTLTDRGAFRIRALSTDEAALVPPELADAARPPVVEDPAADAWLVGRLLKALLAGGTSETLRPRVPSAFRPAMKELLVALLARQPSKRPQSEAAAREIAALLGQVGARAAPVVLREVLAQVDAVPVDDAPPDSVVASLRETCASVKTPPPTFVAPALVSTVVAKLASRSGSQRAASREARRRHDSDRDDAPHSDPKHTVVARRRSTGSDDAHSSGGSDADVDDAGLVFDDSPSGPLRRSPASLGAVPPTEVSTALVALSDLRTADEFAAGHTGVDLATPSSESPSLEDSGSVNAPQHNAGAAFTLAGLSAPDLDLHVDDDIRFGEESPTPRTTRTDAPVLSIAPPTRSVEVPERAIASTTARSGESTVGAVWATGDDESDDEPETRTDRRRRLSAPIPAGADPEATLAFEAGLQGSHDASVFASDDRRRHPKDTASDIQEAPVERTVLLDGSLEGQALRHKDVSRGPRRKKTTPRAHPPDATPKASVVVDENVPAPDQDQTAVLAPGIQERVLSELGSSPWPRARVDDGDATLQVEDPEAVRAIRDAIARRRVDVAADETALVDVSASMPAAPKSKSSKGGDTGVLYVHAPRGASVYVDGKLRGAGEVVVDGVDRFRAVNVRVLLDGHRPWVAEVTCGGQHQVDVRPELIRR